jgi:hypothetical protein
MLGNDQASNYGCIVACLVVAYHRVYMSQFYLQVELQLIDNNNDGRKIVFYPNSSFINQSVTSA